MKLEKVELFGFVEFSLPVACQDKDGKWAYDYRDVFTKYKTKRNALINVDAICAITKINVDIGNVEYKQNPCCRWYTLTEPMKYLVLSDVKEIEVIKIVLVDHSICYLDPKKLSSWLSSQIKKI